MKNRILLIAIAILLIVIFLLGYYFLQSKDDNNNDNGSKVNELSDGVGVINIADNIGTNSTKINDITISNVSIISEEETKLYVELTSKTTNLNDLTLTLILLNSNATASANQKKIKLSGNTTDLESEKNKKILILDISSIYNEPKQIKFNF